MPAMITTFLVIFCMFMSSSFADDATDCNKLWLNINPQYYHAPDNCLQQRTNMTVDSYCGNESLIFWYGSETCDGTGTEVDMDTLYSV